LKSKLQEKIARRLNFNSEYEADTELIGDFIDDAVSEIQVWRKLTNDDEFLSGMYDSNIINFVVESYNQIGAEGQSYDGNGSTTKQYLNTPLSRLKGSIPQRL
jgi:hypothetical protein